MVARPLALAGALATVGLALSSPLNAQAQSSTATPSPPPHVLEVIAEDYAFDAPAAIPAGWTTIRFRNVGEDPHMVIVSRLPEGVTFEDYAIGITQPYNNAWRAVRDQTLPREEAFAVLAREFPAWYPDLEFLGGVWNPLPGPHRGDDGASRARQLRPRVLHENGGRRAPRLGGHGPSAARDGGGLRG